MKRLVGLCGFVCAFALVSTAVARPHQSVRKFDRVGRPGVSHVYKTTVHKTRMVRHQATRRASKPHQAIKRYRRYGEFFGATSSRNVVRNSRAGYASSKASGYLRKVMQSKVKPAIRCAPGTLTCGSSTTARVKAAQRMRTSDSRKGAYLRKRFLIRAEKVERLMFPKSWALKKGYNDFAQTL